MCPPASTSRAAAPGARPPICAIRPSFTQRSPANRGTLVPSTIVPPRMCRSYSATGKPPFTRWKHYRRRSLTVSTRTTRVPTHLVFKTRRRPVPLGRQDDRDTGTGALHGPDLHLPPRSRPDAAPAPLLREAYEWVEGLAVDVAPGTRAGSSTSWRRSGCGPARGQGSPGAAPGTAGWPPASTLQSTGVAP